MNLKYIIILTVIILFSANILRAEDTALPKTTSTIEKNPDETAKPPVFDEETLRQKDRIRISSQKVKSQTGTIYIYKFGQPDKSGILSYGKKFNAAGDLSEEDWFDFSGKISSKSVPTYDKDGKKIGEEWFDAASKLVYRDIYRFGKDGRRSEEIWYNINGQVSYKVVYSYDDTKNSNKRIGYRGDGRRLFQIECSDNQKDMSTTCISSSGTYFQQYGNTTLERLWFSAYGSIFGKELYLHNSSGQLSEYVLNDTTADIIKRVFKYDDKGNILEEIVYNRIQEPVLMIRYTYDYIK
ncbi:MAG: hypothetical protein HQK91_13130 [Nitrospirae bacterium]|nr:hypothetical protein [Nitrospirota bacterium]